MHILYCANSHVSEVVNFTYLSPMYHLYVHILYTILINTTSIIHAHVQVRVKLQHECAARDLWAVLADLPAPAILLKTNLLHSVIDLIGAPFSRTDAGKCDDHCDFITWAVLADTHEN